MVSAVVSAVASAVACAVVNTARPPISLRATRQSIGTTNHFHSLRINAAHERNLKRIMPHDVQKTSYLRDSIYSLTTDAGEAVAYASRPVIC